MLIQLNLLKLKQDTNAFEIQYLVFVDNLAKSQF